MEQPTQYTIKENKQNFIFKGHSILLIILGLILYCIAMVIVITVINIFFNVYADSFTIIAEIFAFAGIYGIAALSLNVEVGQAGLSNFGKVAFFMIGSYATMLSLLFGYPIYIALIIGMIASGFAGYLVALPTLRLREDYLAIVTIVGGEILRYILKAENWITYPQTGQSGGGAFGLLIQTYVSMFPIDLLNLNIFGIHFSFFFPISNNIFGITFSQVAYAELAFDIILMICLIIVYIILETLYNSPWGRVIKSIRENDLATESLGKDVSVYKIKTFIVANAITGFAGGLYAVYTGFILPDSFVPLITFYLWIIIIIGGLANNRGAIAGTFIFWTTSTLALQYKDQLTNFLGAQSQILNPIKGIPFVASLQNLIKNLDPVNTQNILFGVILLLILIYRPQGIISERPIKTIAQRVNVK